MKPNKHYSAIAIMAAFVVALVAGVFGWANHAKANPSYFAKAVSTATATTTLTYMTPGTGTTTLTYDSFYPDSLGGYAKADSALLLTQFTGSSTASILGINVEYSQDSVDWYQDNLGAMTASSSAGVSTIQIQSTFGVSLIFASTTVGGGPNLSGTGTSTAISKRAVILRTPSRYMRVIYTDTGANGGIWGQIVPIREVNK